MRGFNDGPIRFVGGSRHNEIISVTYQPVLQFPVYDPVPIGQWKDEDPILDHRYEIETYELVEMRLGTGCLFLEYHVADRLAKNGYSECDQSGGNGSMRPVSRES